MRQLCLSSIFNDLRQLSRWITLTFPEYQIDRMIKSNLKVSDRIDVRTTYVKLPVRLFELTLELILWNSSMMSGPLSNLLSSSSSHRNSFETCYNQL